MKNIVFVHLKVLRGNFFLLISNFLGKLVFSKTSGSVGFKNIQKRNKDAFQNLLKLGIQYLLKLNGTNEILLKTEGMTKKILRLIQTKFINILELHKIKIFAIKLVNKISHNGCRKLYFKR